ncbi:hypothetical protein [Fibrella arboris]|uniref:hypothetical protein n=1 Tax=Fibrella arboris TaxID=3242486 RepID=UPI00352161E3
MRKLLYIGLLLFGLPCLVLGQSSGTGPFALTAPASATSNLQWYKNGTAVSGATSASYSVGTPGVYWASYDQTSPSSCSGVVTAYDLVLQQGDTDIKSLIGPAGQTAYQWYKGGTAVSGATSATLSLPNTTSAVGTYYLSYNNGTCVITTGNFEVYVITCANPSVGGTVAYAGTLPLCNATNAGTLTLSGQTGNVVKWQTSTDGGTTWTDLAGTSGKTYYSFINAANNQQYRAVVNSGAGCTDANSAPVTITTSAGPCTPASCDDTAGQIAITVPSSATGSNLTKQLIATNAAGQIQYVSAPGSTSVGGVAVGTYYVYRVSFDNTISPLPTLTVGTSLSGIGGGCVAFSNQIVYQVCLSQPPTVAIVSPTANSTITTTPTVSGTATPASTVTVYFPNVDPLLPPVQFCQTTASATGAWSCLGTTTLTGPATITAIATNANGTSIPATTNLVIVPGADVCAATLPLLLPLGSALSIPNYCPTATWIYYKDQPTSPSASMAIEPNGNPWNPLNISIDATTVASHTVTREGKTVQLANRMFHILAPGSFTANGGIKVRLYYNPAEFANLPIGRRTWFKHPAHLKTAVLADLTSETLTNAIAVTPDASGTELGVGGIQVAYVEFHHVTSFSTFGYMGSGTPPTVAITSPAATTTTNTNPPVSGTATALASVTVNAPNNQVCITAADASGNWSCPSLTFTVGSQTVTAIASNTAGVSNTATASFTVVAPVIPPIIAITTPKNVTTTDTNPPVSGTATALASVTVNAPGGQVCITAADAGGNWTCTSLTFAIGSQTVTATASNTAGASSPATANFTVVSSCPNPSVGGTVAYGGTLPLCNASNAGTLTLSGNTGAVVKWQTSTDGGTTFTDVANTSTSLAFTNAANNQQYRAVVYNGGSCATVNSSPVTITTSAGACSVACAVLPGTLAK